MKRDRPVLRGLMAAGLSWLLLVAAITLGMVVPQTEILRGFGAAARLDYSAFVSGFSPLSLAFVADILGLDNPLTADRLESDKGSVASAGAGISPAVASSTAPTTDVEHPFTNDDVDRAYAIASVPFRGRTDTSDGTRSSDEPPDCFPAGGTAWYRFRPKTDVALFSNTFGTPRATALGVYERTDSGALELIGCDTNALGNAQVGFLAAADKSYFFQVTSMVKGGPSVFALAAVGSTTVQSDSYSGAPADGPFERAVISDDGRYVAYMSYGQNHTPTPPDCGNAPHCTGLYLRDRLTEKTTLIASQGTPFPPDDDSKVTISLSPSLSADGRYVAFSGYSNVKEGDGEWYRAPNGAQRPGWNTYVYDRITKRVRLVSRNSAGEPARADPVVNYFGVFSGSFGPSISANGRYILFSSDGANMGAPVEYAEMNVFLRDRVTGKTRLVSTDPSGRPNRADNCAATGRNVSGDGRYVAFMSTLGTASDKSQIYLVYLWDARTGRSRLISRVPAGTEPKGSYCPAVSRDGSRVALVSLDPLVPEDTNETPDVYAYDVASRQIQRISVTSEGEQVHDPNFSGREHGALGRTVNLTADGRYAVFDSAAPDLAPSAVGTTRHPPQTTRVFIHDMVTGATMLASVTSIGEPLAGNSYMPYISADGTAVTFLNTGPNGLARVMVHELSLAR